MPTVYYYVINEQYLCYWYPDTPYAAYPLRANVANGGDPFIPASGGTIPFNAHLDQYREATIADFDQYRICHKGHITA